MIVYLAPEYIYGPVLLKLGCAALAGLILGLEREYNGHVAGLRTTLLVCLAPALAVIMTDHLWVSMRYSELADDSARGRIIQGLFAGVGFIGGGVILKQGDTDTVRGVTTAAVLWIATTLGVVFGLGLYGLGFIGLGITIVIVYLLTFVTPSFHTRHHATLSITADSGALTAATGVHLLSCLHIQATVKSFDFNNTSGSDTFRFTLKYRHRETLEIPARVKGKFSTIPGVRQIHWN